MPTVWEGVCGLRQRALTAGMTQEAISTPCAKVCAVDGRTGLCAGCGRTLKEIADWTAMDEPQRRAIMAELPARLAPLSAPA